MACAQLPAQVVPTASLTGVVTDDTGALVPSASIEITNTATHIAQRHISDAGGRFLFNFLPPGTYHLAVSASGFGPYHQTGITLDVNAPATVQVHLAVQSVSQETTVNANAQMVDTESGTLHQIVNEKYAENLPLNGRNAASLVYMAPGTVAGKGEDTATYANNSDALAISVNGTYGDQVAYKLDGATHQDLITNVNATFPDPDALAEFSVQTNNFDARYGGAGGAIVNIVTKSGADQIHGSAFEYVRNGDFERTKLFCGRARRSQAQSIRRHAWGADPEK
jgi:hypothetical protein